MPTPLPPRRPEEGAAESPPWRGLSLTFLGISALVLLALTVMFLQGSQGGRGRPLEVAILLPRVSAPGPLSTRAQERVVEAMAESALRALATREGLHARVVAVDPCDPTCEDGDSSSRAAQHAEAARRMGADEALVLELACDSERCRASMRRLRAVDGSLQWRRSFRLETTPLTAIDAKLANELHIAYLKFERREGGARLLCSPEIYVRYLDALADLRRGRLSAHHAAAIFATVRGQAPRLFEAYLREAEQRVHLGKDAEQQAAIELLFEARRIAPGDWRAPVQLVPHLLRQEESRRAGEVLEELRLLLPGDDRLEQWRRHAEQGRDPKPDPA